MQPDLSIPLNSQSQVVRTHLAAICSTLVEKMCEGLYKIPLV